MAQQGQTAGRRKQRVGTVVSDKMDKTVVVALETFKRHRIYKKLMRRTKRVKAHNEHNEARLGDTVRIEETRPLSRDKRWRVVEIVQRREVPEVAPAEAAEVEIPGARAEEPAAPAAEAPPAPAAQAAPAPEPAAEPEPPAEPAAEPEAPTAEAAPPEEEAPAPEEEQAEAEEPER